MIKQILYIFFTIIFTFSTAVNAEVQSLNVSKEEVLLSEVKDNNKIYYGLTSQDIKSLLETTPISFDQTQDDWGDPQFMLEIANKEIILFTYKCNDGICEDIRLYTYWRTGGRAPDLKAMNSWNIEQRWTKSYVDADNDIVLEIDLDVKDGVSKKAMLNLLEIYADHVFKFSEYIGMR